MKLDSVTAKKVFLRAHLLTITTETKCPIRWQPESVNHDHVMGVPLITGYPGVEEALFVPPVVCPPVVGP